ncbi:MAG: phosphonatase-like hydrolase [Acidimicrobiaceae bacterium]|nr:phosphonatase-like hydrolase [Acidimicrobiaceae bacterium]
MTIELICFDMAGTTVNDHGLVLEAFRRTIEELDVVGDDASAAEAYVIETMGQSKIEVFSVLFDDRAQVANEAFERHFVTAACEVGVSEVPGARAAIETLKSRGVAVALTTGFSPSTREALIELLGWSDLINLRVSPADAGRGRPAPDMVLLCALSARVSAVQSVMVVGDTASDMQAGRRAGVGQCVGVLTGTDDQARLMANGADLVLCSVADLPKLDTLVA